MVRTTRAGLGLILGLFLALPGASQSIPLTQFCGVNNDSDPAAIEACQAQDALNVESNRTGTTIRKRRGTAPFLTLGAGTAGNSIFALKNNAGNECLIIANNTGKLYRSINSGTAVEFSTITSGARLYCQSDNGKAYCFTSSNDTPFSYDCQTYYAEQQGNGYPNGKFNVFTQDRQLVAGATDYPNRLYLSQAGNISNFTPATDDVSPFFEDIGRSGDKITGVYFLNGRVMVFKEYSIGGFNVTDQFNSTYYDISNRVGITGPEAVLVHDGVLYFKGSDNEFYRMDGTPGQIEKLSSPIKRIVAAALTGRTRYVILTDKTDWDAGNYNGQGPLAAMSGSVVVGAVVPSSITLADTSASDFSSGALVKVSTGDSIGSVTLSSTVAQENFADGDYTSNPTWIVTGGGFGVDGSYGIYGNQSADNTIQTDSRQSSGSWRFVYRYNNESSLSATCAPIGGSIPGTCAEFRFMVNHSGDFYSARFYINASQDLRLRLVKKVGSESVLGEYTYGSSFPKNESRTFTISRTTDGVMSVSDSGSIRISATDTDVFVSTVIVLRSGFDTGNNRSYFDDIFIHQYLSSGSFVSRIFDTGLSTPTAGPLSSTVTFTSGETAVYFDVRNSSSPNNDLWTAFVPSSTTLNFGLNKRYWQYRARFWTVVSSKTPTLDAIELAATTTGQYITSCIEPGTGITAWGSLEMAGVFTGAGTNFTIENSTGTSCTDPSIGNSWAVTSTGTTISTETAAAYKVRVTFNLGSTTDTARMDSLTVNWTEGSVAPPSYVAYWDDGIYFSISTGTTGNNRVIKYDLNTGALWPFDMGWNSPINFNNILYFGSTTTAKILKYSANDPDQAPNTDDGSSINAYWRSKALSAGDPFVEKQLDKISTVVRKEGGGTLSGTWRVNGNTNSGSYSVNLSTGVNVVRSNYSVPVGQVGTFFDLQLGNNSVYPFEILGLRLDLTPKPWRPLP